MSTRPARRGPLARAVADSVKVGPVTPADQAAAELAKRYAVALDADPDPALLNQLGPKLLATLTALGLTAAGRSARGGAPAPPAVDDELAAARRRAAERRVRANGGNSAAAAE